ncbi:MAG TPA: hypothetical protein O0X14_02130 [Methanocorpusculum sp.]|nr:hypothetical protein [Methanocorpusculum sp.]
MIKILEQLNTLLGDCADNFTTAEKNLRIEINTEKVKEYCNITALSAVLNYCVLQMCVEDLNKKNSEGLSSESYAGNSYGYIDGYSTEIKSILNKNRRISTW